MERNASTRGAAATGARSHAQMRAPPILKTTRALRYVKSINDIVAIESEPYEANIAARSLYDLLKATAALHPERPAMTALSGDRSLEPLLSLTHSQLLVEITRAANLFAAVNRGREGVVAVRGRAGRQTANGRDCCHWLERRGVARAVDVRAFQTAADLCAAASQGTMKCRW